MFGRFKNLEPFHATILFPAPPHPEHWEKIQTRGVTVHRETGIVDNFLWSFLVEHPQWGRARVFRVRDAGHLPRQFFEYSRGLTSRETDEADQFKAPIFYWALDKDSGRPEVRKDHFRLIREIMGDQSRFMIDELSCRVWSITALDEELDHDSELGVQGLMDIHVVKTDEDRIWLHSHGLSQLGRFDFDLVDLPHQAHILFDWSGVNSIATAIMEGTLTPEVDRFQIANPGIQIRMVPARKFNRSVGSNRAEKLRPGSEEDHSRDRCVACEPRSRWFFGKTCRPSRALKTEELGHTVILFSDEATRQMEQRARKTLKVFQQYLPFAAEYEMPAIVKLGLDTSCGGKEHPWFQVHEIGDDWVDGTLLNQPFNIPGLNEGDRGRFPISRLTEWKIVTPMGMADSESTVILREVKDKISEAAASSADQSGNRQ